MFPNAFRIDVRIYAAAASIILSLWCIVIDNVVNNDGALYLQTATLFGQGEWRDAFELYRWPAYSALIAVLHAAGGFNYDTSAYILSTLLNAAIVVAFISIVKQLGGGRRTMALAALVILVYPGINDYRSFVIRDTGYLALYLLALLYLFRYTEAGRPASLLASAAAMAGAALFRVEGLVVLVLAPLILAVKRGGGARTVLVLTLLGVLALVGILLAFAGWRGHPQHPGEAGGLSAVMLQQATEFWRYASAGGAAAISAIREQVLNPYSAEYAPLVYAGAVVIIFVAETLARVGPVFLALAVYACYKNLVFRQTGTRRVWLWIIILHSGILLGYVATELFLTGRFPLALALTVLLAAPFGLEALYQSWLDRRAHGPAARWLWPAAAALLVLGGIASLNQFTGKHYIKDAGAWLAQHKAASTTLLTNNWIVSYYSEIPVRHTAMVPAWDDLLASLGNGRWSHSGYAAVYIKRRDHAYERKLLDTAKTAPVAAFESEHGGKVLIFARPGVSGR